jgi:hypothetical protein
MKFRLALAFFLAPLAAFALVQGPTARASAPDHTSQSNCLAVCTRACAAQDCVGLEGPVYQQCEQVCRDGCSCNCGLMCP